ncbi:LAMI_0F03510g1_1 [Lachancea mirantina]|uniref:LAMI_0F03510g1_1 n=1 Tax=Lachancea mirantina TaxID=1230905 RepID=A0A1G4JX99_9SACH|nr:LAMI_0F03510g1_1 [Lachancea mirantina]
MTSIKQLAHLSFDLALISVILAGLRRNTGYVLAYETSDLKKYVRRYLDWGEYLFDKLIGMAGRSAYFRKETPIDGFMNGIYKRVEELGRTPRSTQPNNNRSTTSKRPSSNAMN